MSLVRASNMTTPLKDSGVEVTAENNIQHLRNNIAKDAIRVLGK
jgi:hypothetical protein